MAMLVILLLNVIVAVVNGHVSLTFPPARKYDFDFLDTFRTQKPCGGMKKGDIRTTLQAGRDLEVTWHMGHPHKGGFKIELLDHNGKLFQELTPRGLYAGADRIETQSYPVALNRETTCRDCTIRLVRQALEWGDKYQFHSCADVTIVSESVNDCSGHGSYRGSGCNCQRTYHGDRCQYKEDCLTDDDCNRGNGRCIDIKSTVLPSKQCFCKPGYFGINCEGQNANVTSADFDESLYTKVPGHKIDFYWRKVNRAEEFEGVIVGKETTSWVAVGWRPKDLTKACQAFPRDATRPGGRDFHGMDCTDIVLGSVRDGSYTRVLDYYTRDRSTPRYDSVFGGKDDITGAAGKEQDGRTVIVFRKKTLATHETDHPFQGELHFIWAHGRNDLDFFGDDELKYHGPLNKASAKIMVSSAGKASFSLAFLISAVLFAITSV